LLCAVVSRRPARGPGFALADSAFLAAVYLIHCATLPMLVIETTRRYTTHSPVSLVLPSSLLFARQTPAETVLPPFSPSEIRSSLAPYLMTSDSARIPHSLENGALSVRCFFSSFVRFSFACVAYPGSCRTMGVTSASRALSCAASFSSEIFRPSASPLSLARLRLPIFGSPPSGKLRCDAFHSLPTLRMWDQVHGLRRLVGPT